MNNSKNLVPIVRAFARNINSSAIKNSAVQEKPHPRFQKLKELQQRFQVEDGVPVYLKKGTSDKILFQATTALMFVGLGMSLKTLWDLSFGKFLNS